MQQLSITLREITAHNWEQVADLQVVTDQENFVAPNTFSLLQAAYGVPHEPDLKLVPLAVCANDEIVGFVLYSEKPNDHRRSIERLMIDAKHQRKGYGKAAMQILLNVFRAEPQVKEVSISYVPENEAARRLYAQLGIEVAGMEGDEIAARLVLNE